MKPLQQLHCMSSLFPPALLASLHQFGLLWEVCTAPCTLLRQNPAGIGNEELNHPLPQSRAVTAGGFCSLDRVKEP